MKRSDFLKKLAAGIAAIVTGAAVAESVKKPEVIIEGPPKLIGPITVDGAAKEVIEFTPYILEVLEDAEYGITGVDLLVKPGSGARVRDIVVGEGSENTQIGYQYMVTAVNGSYWQIEDGCVTHFDWIHLTPVMAHRHEPRFKKGDRFCLTVRLASEL